MDTDKLRSFLQTQAAPVAELLCDLIRFPSTVGNEGPVVEYMAEKFAGLADTVERVPIPEDIKDDPDYSFPLRGLEYGGRPNLRVIKRGTGSGNSVIFNTHVDVVPPSQQHEKAFQPGIVDGVIVGRGACDAKGQIATLYALLLALDGLDVELGGDIDVHLVIEEEIGGNGTVAMMRQQPAADAAIVMEPTDFAIMPQVRGAVWFEVTCYGQSGHSGAPGGTVSALLKAIEVIRIFTDYHDRALAESRGKFPLFDEFDDPAPLTIGQLEAGEWPSVTPDRATFAGLLGLMPDRTKEQMMEELQEVLRTQGDEWLAEHSDIEFTYRHDANVIPEDHPLVKQLQQACGEVGRTPRVSAMTASCDAWLYNNQLKIPTVVFGPGELGVAHGNREQIRLGDILTAAEVLVHFLRDWCGSRA